MPDSDKFQAQTITFAMVDSLDSIAKVLQSMENRIVYLENLVEGLSQKKEPAPQPPKVAPKIMRKTQKKGGKQ